MLRIKNGWMVAVAAVAMGAVGASCSEDSPQPERDDDQVQEEETPVQGSKDSSTPKPGKSDAGTGTGTGTSSDAGKRDSGAPVAGDKAIPCDVQKLVDSKCGSCHGAKPAGGAPFSLQTLAQFQADMPGDDSKKIHEAAYERMMETEPALKMPPPSVKITAAESKTLSDWLNEGAPAGEACSTGDTTVKPDGGTPPATDKSGGVSITPVTYTDPDVKCYEFKAFAKSGDLATPYSVPTTPDFYVAFTVMPQWKGVQYIKSFKTIIDNEAVLHHWLFFKQSGAASKSVVENAIGAHPDGDMLAGWAPGGDDMWFDPDVGMEANGSVAYQLEMHYNNKTGKAAPDASGVEVCVTPNKPEHVAAVAWLGTDGISGTSATGTCTPRMSAPVHLIAGSPHMHVKGRHMKVILNRKGGAKETIHDDDFAFEYQRQYVLDYLINPGDTITTTCTYSGPSRFGKGTNDEMCYFFSTHWPAGGLSSIGPGTLIHGPNACLN